MDRSNLSGIGTGAGRYRADVALRDLPSRYAGWVALAVSLSLYGLLSAHRPFYVGPVSPGFFDLTVYRDAAHLAVHGSSLLDTSILYGFRFTYPPFAALAFTPLLAGSLFLDELVITAINVAALVAVTRFALKLVTSSARVSTPKLLRGQSRWSLVALVAAAVLWLEPVTTTIGYGQVDLVIAALILFDITRPDESASKGAAIGLAAGLKLTPMIFVPYLFLTGRRRAAAVAAGVFAATVAVGFAVFPSASAQYWGGAFLNASRVGPIAAPANQSLQGAAARLSGPLPLSPRWLAAVAVVCAVGFAVAVLASRRGDEAAGFSLCAITGLLASPISWTHHWALAVPALLLFGLRAYERRSRVMLLSALVIAAIGYSYVTERYGLHWRHSTILSIADPYVVIGVLAIAGGAWRAFATHASRQAEANGHRIGAIADGELALGAEQQAPAR